MDRVLINPAIVSDIAEAVREKKKTTDQIEVAQLPAEIRSIKGVGDNVREVVEAVTGVVADDDTTLANAIARASVDTPTEQIWNGERQTAGGAIEDGVAFVQSVKGQSLKVVQIIDIAKFVSKTASGLTFSVNNGYIIVDGTATAGAVYSLFECKIFAGHRYVLVADSHFSITGMGSGGQIKTVTTDRNGKIGYFTTTIGEVFDNTESKLMCFDLTAMGMEDVTTADEFAQRLGYSSIDEFPYIPYTEGEVVGMRADSIVSKTKYKTVDMGTLAWSLSSNYRFRAVIRDSIHPEYRDLTLLKNTAGYTSVVPQTQSSTATEDRTICYVTDFISSSSNGVSIRDSAYSDVNSFKEAMQGVMLTYESTELSELATFPLDLSTIQHEGAPLFPDGLHGIGDVKDEVDWANGRAVKRIGKLVLDGVTRRLSGALLLSNGMYRFAYAPASDTSIYRPTSAYLSDKLVTVKSYYDGVPAYSIYNTQDSTLNRMFIILPSTISTDATANAWLQANNVEVLYELATPIEVTFDPAKAFYKVSNGGTEELVSEGFTAPLTAEIGYKGQLNGEILNLL